MWIKICANTNLEDTLLAAHLGASAVGFVFAVSPRQISPAQASLISSKLPRGVERIGVFQTEDPEAIIAAVQTADLTGAQLHGQLDLKLVERLRHVFADSLTLIQTVHWKIEPRMPQPIESVRHHLHQLRHEPIDRVLIDSQKGALLGGTGVSFDWDAATTLLDEFADRKLILAGGLQPENVNQAINTLKPWGVDVASGVESSPGHKDPKKLEAFIRKASL